ncbi:cystathionine beta-synthase [Aequorivita marisscotiae]|uniref:Cystathionine beta-synthase n=1 Tax=Aequorivita marisscotiae TaxID=3040348 RepID=A0ABY8KV60_9FLAO|nr:cystathionine beta-synthase [Aequorivita sp. Ant34-E75]WGF91940.1 cystathionine beta-synthase [Aequorivita sp. Ant34-E75]
MKENKIKNYIGNVLKNMPMDWINLTTHRLDIYEEQLAKKQFLTEFEALFNNNNFDNKALSKLPTAYDYIRLGHPLSSVLEWGIAHLNNLNPDNVISFSSKTIPVFAVLRKNLLTNKNTQILYKESLPLAFDAEILQRVYGYKFTLKKIDCIEDFTEADNNKFDGSVIYISENDQVGKVNLHSNIDFYINHYKDLGSFLIVNGNQNESYISEIQHVRRRETIAMTPANSLSALNLLVENNLNENRLENNNHEALDANKNSVINSIREITGSHTKVQVASSGLSMQYAIMMGLIHDALENHKGKEIKFIVPPNCYGGTNDQARRVAASIDNVEVVDLLVDGENEMVSSIDQILDKIARQDAVPYIIAEIPTNPRVEVPNLENLLAVLSADRKTSEGKKAVAPVFILDQTFCPNVHFLGEGEILSTVKTIAYVSGSKFPSGGRCTAGYCVGNKETEALIDKIELHLHLCDNEATELQYKILANQLPSMNQRIAAAYKNTREFVNYIHKTLPEAKINFVSDALAARGFTPSVFSLDLPTKGSTADEREAYKRSLNLKLINLMITEIAHECKFCVSYGQLKGSYWTIPATSTQGTTKEGDKDYIVRVSISPTLDLELHKKVFAKFVESI